MNKPYLVALVLSITLSACGVRNEEPEPGSAVAVTPTGGGTSVGTTGGSSGSSSSSNGGTTTDAESDDQATEGGVVVQLRFLDSYTGFWENDTRGDSQTTEILRIAFGVNRYHMRRYYDQSSGAGALMQNCFIRESGIGVQRELSARGLWFELNTTTIDGNPVSTEDGWTLMGSQLDYSYFDAGVENTAVAKTYTRVFPGLAVDGLQICEEGS